MHHLKAKIFIINLLMIASLLPAISTVPGINRRDRNNKSLSGKTIAKKRSIVTDNVARTDPKRKV